MTERVTSVIVSSRVILWIGLVLGLAVIVFFTLVDPVQCVWAPKCLFHTVTGLQCPGCGFSRAMHALLHGNVARAVSYNYFMVLSVPYALAVIVTTYIPAFPLVRRYGRFILGRVAAYLYIALFMVWWVVRNIFGV